MQCAGRCLLDTTRWRTHTELSTGCQAGPLARLRRRRPLEIFDWIEVLYNRTRRHSPLGMLAPMPMAAPPSACPSTRPVANAGLTERIRAIDAASRRAMAVPGRGASCASVNGPTKAVTS